jgi:uncharacterized damage-inducible protein DinB
MTAPTLEVIVPLPGYRSREVSLFAAQLDALSAWLTKDTRDLTPEALVWQPAPGLNTIGMLLAHIAIVEVYWTQVGALAMTEFETESALGIGIDDDGMPLAAGGPPAATLMGRDLAFFDDLLARARDYSKQAMARIADADLEREITRHRPDGTVRGVVNLRWILYHVLEHQAGHHGQVNLLRHQYRIATGGA